MKMIAFVTLALCACGPVDIGGGGGSPSTDATSASDAGAGGAAPCDPSERPRPLRRVSVRDSRGLEPGTLVLAVAPEPQTLWLPSANDSNGATIIVKEAMGSSRRITVLAINGDTFADGSTEYETMVPWSSTTIVSVDDAEFGHVWLPLDAAE